MKDYGIFLNKETSNSVVSLLKEYLNKTTKCKFLKVAYSKIFDIQISQQPFGGDYSFYTKSGVYVGSVTQTENGVVCFKNY